MTKETSEFWQNILLAAETEPKKVSSILGASGYSHPVVALGVDEKRRRVVMISGESDARSAALAQGDVQAAMPSVKVVMARPLAVNLSSIAKVLSTMLGNSKISEKEIDWIGKNQEEFNEKAKAAGEKIGQLGNVIASQPFEAFNLNFIAMIKDAVQQLSLVEVEENKGDKPDVKSSIPTIDVKKLSILDPAEADRNMGVCSLPLYEFTDEDIETLKSKVDVERTKAFLRQYDVLQYFFPAADQLALGLVDHGRSSVDTLIDQLKRTPSEGHPYGSLELLNSEVMLDDLIPALQEKGLLVEGEIGFEVSPDGQQYRAQVKFKPRESLINKLSRVFSVKVDISLKDLFK